jgi:hypothetical protein
VLAAFNARGWFFIKTAPKVFEWQKLCPEGRLLARQDGPEWHDDHAAAMLELGHG